MKEVQISAYVSDTTKEQLERHVRSSGMKKGFLIEAALQHHLQALRELPLDVIVQPKVVISRRSAENLLARLDSTEPTSALRELMTGHGD